VVGLKTVIVGKFITTTPLRPEITHRVRMLDQSVGLLLLLEQIGDTVNAQLFSDGGFFRIHAIDHPFYRDAPRNRSQKPIRRRRTGDQIWPNPPRSRKHPDVVTVPEVSTEATPETQPEGENPVVIIKTGKGDIKVKLFKDKAPITVENFLKYVDSGHYEGTIFHRVIPNFMIQGGGFTSDMQQKPTLAPIKNEAQNGLANKRGTLAMARTQVIDSATSQFFINVVDNAFLNFRSPDMQGFGYCVFGEVVEGMDVVDAIRSVQPADPARTATCRSKPIEIIQVVRVDSGN
jgi:cyclophilin family peptidyl-prolyl cis-trans isomerase